MKENIVLVDGNYAVIRSIMANPGLRSSIGELTGGLYLFLRTLWTISDNSKNIVVVFDGGKNKSRLDIYPEYKLRKKKSPEEETERDRIVKETMDFTFGSVGDLLELMGVPYVRIKGEEADDIIHFLAKKLSQTYNVVVASDDSDYIQMVSSNVSVFRPMKGDTISLNNLSEIFPYPIEYFTLYKSLTGDSSDNITSVSGIGEGTALKMIDYLVKNSLPPTPESLFKWGESGKSKRHESMRLKENIDIIERNLNLIDINRMLHNEPLYIQEYKKAIRGIAPDPEELIRKFHRYEFKTLSCWIDFAMKKANTLR